MESSDQASSPSNAKADNKIAPSGTAAAGVSHVVPMDRELLIQKQIEQLSQMKLNETEGSDQDKKVSYIININIDRSIERLQATIEWRKHMGISRMLSDPTWLAKERDMRKTLWYDYLGPDHYGRSVLVERPGRWDVGTVLSSIWPHYYAKNYKDGVDAAQQDQMDEESFVKLLSMACEIMLLQMDHRHYLAPDTTRTSVKDGDDRGMIIIMDLMGLRPRHLNPRLLTAFRKIAAVNSAHYPDTLAHVWVVNAPYLFNALSRMVKPFLKPDTVGKFHVSRGVPPELAKCVGTDCLPEELGGSRKAIFPYKETSALSDYPPQIK